MGAGGGQPAVFALLIQPFFAPIFWACAISVVFYPFQKRLLARWPQRRNLVALFTLLLCVVLVIIPVLFVATSFCHRRGRAVPEGAKR